MNVLKYWRNSLADADRLDPDFLKRRAGGFLIHYNAIESGSISPEIVKKYISRTIDKKKTIFDVLVCPTITYIKKEHGSQKNSNLPEAIAPLWIPALMDASGTLRPHSRFTPWICRDYLEPSETEVLPMGTIQQVDEYLYGRSINRENWEKYFQFTLDLFKSVTGLLPLEWNHEQYQLSEECYLFSNDLVFGTSRAIQDLYGYIELDRVQAPLLQKFASIASQPPISPFLNLESDKLSVKHYGQMSNQFCLSSSQRQSMHHVTLLDQGDLLAVNGPPGTGKTTLLQSIVATSVIRHALNKSEPPIIVVSSTNNNAVTNVINSFGKVNEVGENSLAGRWIPEIKSYGAYLKSSFSSEQTASDWLTILNGKGGFAGYFEKIETRDFLVQATHYYLEKCNSHFSHKIENLNQAVDLLHEQLVQKSLEIEIILNFESA